MLKISKPLAELLGFEWKKRPEFKDILARPDKGKPSFYEYCGNRDPHDQFIEMSPLQVYKTRFIKAIESLIYKEGSIICLFIAILWKTWWLEM